MSRSACSTACRTSAPIATSSAFVGPVLASTTSSVVRMTVSGVRSSWLALAMNRRWLANARLEAAEHVVECVGELAQFVPRPASMPAAATGCVRWLRGRPR